MDMSNARYTIKIRNTETNELSNWSPRTYTLSGAEKELSRMRREFAEKVESGTILRTPWLEVGRA